MNTGIRIIFLVVCLGVFADTKSNELSRPTDNPNPHPSIDGLEPVLQTGDLIFRNGKGFISDMLRNTSQRERSYSHVGILVWENQVPMVYHMIEDANNHALDSDLHKEPFAEFCTDRENNRIAVYRFLQMDASKEAPLRSDLKRIEAAGTKFDDQFRLDSDHSLYCTELVFKTLFKILDVHVNPSKAPNGYYIGLDDLYLCKDASLIAKTNFQDE